MSVCMYAEGRHLSQTPAKTFSINSEAFKSIIIKFTQIIKNKEKVSTPT